MISTNIKPDMPVICSLNGHFATVDHIGDGSKGIKLNKDKNGQHHYIPLSWVASTDHGKVKVDRPGEEVMRKWSTTPLTLSLQDVY